MMIVPSLPKSSARMFSWLFAAALFALSCRSATAQPQPLDKDHAAKMAKGLVLFQKHVKPLLIDRCLRCHGGERIRGGLDLTDRRELLQGGDKGPAVVPGKAKESLLYKLITHQREPHMPQDGKKLALQEIAHIAEWINLGAPYDDPLVARKGKGPSWTQRRIDPADRRFWSYQPLKNPEPPAVKNKQWCRTSVDPFILAKMEQVGIRPNPEATKRKLIRRAYLELIGIPPTPEEVDAFLNDPRSDAWDRLIDRLLASPHYGERWASHWLDLARFAESHGFEHDYDRKTAYHYRDFVIKALNMDLPYDTFVRWQIAGDELEPKNNLANMATGFLAAGVHSTQITKNEVEKHRYDELDDKLHTLGTAMLGLTIGCARCHDHKYDAIPQADYYRMLATFTTTVRSEVDMDLDPEGYQKEKAKFDAAHAPLVEELRRFEKEQLPARLAAWEKERPQPAWIILDQVKAKSVGGATLTLQPDGSILATGKNPNNDTYTIEAETDLQGISAIRIEALADKTMVKNGPGRAANGNFALSDLKMFVREKGSKADFVPLTLTNPRATFEQKGLPIRAAIDQDAKTGWAVDPMFGRDHAGVFDVPPLRHANGSEIRIVLEFKTNTGHNIGRLRLSVTTMREKAGLTDVGLPHSIQSILRMPVAKRSAAQREALLKWYSTVDAEGRKLHERIRQHLASAPRPKVEKVLIATEGLPAVRLHTQGEDFFDKTYFLRRGDVNNKEGVAEPGFLQVLMTAPDGENAWRATPPAGWRTSYRRTALANWITDTQHGAGHLLARVIVNRLWQHHLGQGIVATPSDFGVRGAKPSHPELLDHLASELIKNGWRLKPIHKLIMTSAVYRQSSEFNAASYKADPDNTYFWHYPRRRLEGETIRDSLLAVSGELDRSMFGPGTLDESMKRRSIYFTVKRSKLIPMLQIFDAPQYLTGIGKRPSTTVAPQALWLMNNPEVRKWSHSFARRIGTRDSMALDDAVRKAYQMALARDPSPAELVDGTAFLREQMQSYAGADRREKALTDFCQALLCTNEFIYLD